MSAIQMTYLDDLLINRSNYPRGARPLNWKALDKEYAQQYPNVPQAPLRTVGSLVDGCFGLIVGTVAIFPSLFSSNAKEAVRYAREKTYHLALIPSHLFKGLITTINSKANATLGFECNGMHGFHNGILTGRLQTGVINEDAKRGGVNQLGGNARTHNNFLVCHIGSRFIYLAGLIGSLITRIIDFVIGLIAMVAAIFTLGKWDKANEYAMRGLQITGIIPDIQYYVGKMINPSS